MLIFCVTLSIGWQSKFERCTCTIVSLQKDLLIKCLFGWHHHHASEAWGWKTDTLFFFPEQLSDWQSIEIIRLGITDGGWPSEERFVSYLSCFSKTTLSTLLIQNLSICILACLQSFMTMVVTSSIKTRFTCSVWSPVYWKKKGK